MAVDAACLHCPFKRYPPDTLESLRHELIGSLLDDRSGGRIRRAAVGRVVLDPAVFRGVVGRGDDHTVCPASPGTDIAVTGKDGMGNHRGWRIAKAVLDEHRHVVRGKDFDGAGKGRFGQGVRVHAEEEGTVGVLRLPVLADRLADGKDMRLVETVPERRPPVARGSEGRQLGGIGDIRVVGVIRGDQSRNVFQQGSWRRLSGEFMCIHSLHLFPFDSELDDFCFLVCCRPGDLRHWCGLPPLNDPFPEK